MLCTGNICRSPAAEAVMKGVLDKRGLQTDFFVDSCGTGGGSSNWYKESGFSYHEGDLADPRMRAAARKRGLKLESRSRPLAKDDFDKFEVIVAMDSYNLSAIETARQYWNVDSPKARIVLMSEFSPDESFKGKPIPDPYWSGADGFEYALDLIEGACEGLADHLIGSARATSQ
ncbi:protein tyrosine phosphatase [Gracilaria domingensis]|nr:protein tyrosine phosphatase [Gracilaria domingensis]